MKKRIVISGINIVNGGAMSVYRDLLDAIIKEKLYLKDDFIILVSKKKLFEKYRNKFNIIEFPKSKKRWVNRLYYEYVYFWKLSKQLKPDIWLSMHDITPNVIASKRYVYCHNPSPFYNMPLKEAKYGLKYYLFSKFYKYLYRINIHKNNAVIVQQQWIAEKFKKMYNINNIIVARPTISVGKIKNDLIHDGKIKFIYPSFPRPFKNFETLCKATKLLDKKGLKNKFEVYITLDGTENNYSRMLFKKYGMLSNLKFIGIQPREKLYKLYSQCNCLVFISKLETWGMPLIEFRSTGKSIITSNLSYAHETLEGYSNVSFVDSFNYINLSKAMKKKIRGEKIFYKNYSPLVKEFKTVESWHELCKVLFND